MLLLLTTTFCHDERPEWQLQDYMGQLAVCFGDDLALKALSKKCLASWLSLCVLVMCISQAYEKAGHDPL